MSNQVSRAEQVTPDVRNTAKHRVHHFFTRWNHLEGLYPGSYPRELVRGEGQYLYDDTGARLLDGCQHLAACAIGHGRPEMAEAIAEQVRTLEFCSLDEGHSHPWLSDLAERLAPIVPLDDPKFYFVASGSEGTETALKIARAYHSFRGEPSRVKFLARSGSYHGMAFGGLSASGNPALREPYQPVVPGFIRASQPSPGRCGYCTRESGCNLGCAHELERLLQQEGPSTVAAFIGEPIPMHEAVKVPDDRYWPEVREICDRYGILLITDEVVTGFGRTGRMFGAEHWDLRPDVMILGKGLSSAYVPFGAAVAARHVAETFVDRPLMHNNTYAGHPVCCAAALKNLSIIQGEDLPGNAAGLEPIVREGLSEIADSVDRVFRTSVKGLLSSLEFGVAGIEEGAGELTRIRHECYERGLLIRGQNDDAIGAVFFYPPLVATEEDVRFALGVMRDVIGAELG